MENLMNYAKANAPEVTKQLETHYDTIMKLNPFTSHASDEVEKEVNFAKAAISDVNQQVTQFSLPQNPERNSIMNKINFLLKELEVTPRAPVYWNRTKEEARSYHLHNSHSTAEHLRNLVRDLWATVRADKADRDLHDYREKKLRSKNEKRQERREERLRKGERKLNEGKNVNEERTRGQWDRMSDSNFSSNYRKRDEDVERRIYPPSNATGGEYRGTDTD